MTDLAEQDAIRKTKLAITLRGNEATVFYNAACVFCLLKRKSQALKTIRKAWKARFKDADWARRDPDLAPLHGHLEFQTL